MNTIILNSNLKFSAFIEAVDEQRPNIIAILREYGPLARSAIRYFLKTQYAVTTDDSTLLQMIALIQDDDTIEEITTAAEILYCLPGDEHRDQAIPAQKDYALAYVELFLRHRLIRNNPELATIDDGYLDALYKPMGNQEGGI